MSRVNICGKVNDRDTILASDGKTKAHLHLSSLASNAGPKLNPFLPPKIFGAPAKVLDDGSSVFGPST